MVRVLAAHDERIQIRRADLDHLARVDRRRAGVRRLVRELRAVDRAVDVKDARVGRAVRLALAVRRRDVLAAERAHRREHLLAVIAAAAIDVHDLVAAEHADRSRST